MIEYIKLSLFNKKFFLGERDSVLVWADWDEPEGKLSPKNSFLLKVVKELAEYQSGIRKKFDFKMTPDGSDFQIRVWRELEKIPWGKTVSYLDVATSLGCPQSVRAVASAIGKNPIAIFIPCHRVISKSGTIGGYSGGLPTKIKLLKVEGHQFLEK